MSDSAVSIKKPKAVVTGQADDAAGAMPPPDRMICACANLNFAGLKAAVAKLQNQSFEKLLEQTDSGNTCTACLLDLEYYFVALKAQNKKLGTAPAKGGAGAIEEPKLPFKQHVYRLLDSIAPPLAWAPPNRVPIVTGRGIETWLTVTNHDLLFQDRKSAPLVTTVRIRDGNGNQVMRGKFQIAQGEELKFRLDKHLTPGNGGLSVGSAEVFSRAKHPAMRGTMRPQLEILAPAGTCGLHAQGDTGPGDNWFTVQNRPKDQRLFLIVMNTTGQAQSAAVTYPHEDRGRVGDTGVRTPVALAPFGTALSEIVLPDALGEEIGARPFSVRARAEGACRVYLVCATPALDRFSIDHR